MTFGEWLRWFSNLFVKEFLTYFIDPASRFILVVPLIIQIFLFGYTATFDLNHAPIAVLNESHGRFSQQLVSQNRRFSDFLHTPIFGQCFSDEGRTESS